MQRSVFKSEVNYLGWDVEKGAGLVEQALVTYLRGRRLSLGASLTPAASAHADGL